MTFTERHLALVLGRTRPQFDSAVSPLHQTKHHFVSQTTKTNMNEINREQFEAWLFSQPRERVWVYLEGSNKSPRGCLLCNFLRDIGHKTFSIGGMTFKVYEDKALPEWFIGLMSEELTKGAYVRRTMGEAQDHYLRLYPTTFTDSDRVPLGQSNNQTTPGTGGTCSPGSQ